MQSLTPSFTLLVSSLLAASCASGPSVRPGEETLARGGELAGELPERALKVDGNTVSVWGITEVPDGSRLQLAFSGVDAITRAELLKAVRVRVQSSMSDLENGSARSLELTTVERVAGLLEHAGPLPHGWSRVRKERAVVLRLWARLSVSREALEAALQAPLAGVGRTPGEFVAGLELSAK